MKLLDKIKNAIFEEEEFDEEFRNEELPPKKKVTLDEDDEEIRRSFRKRAMEERAKALEEQKQEEETKYVDDIVKQIDVDKTVPKRAEVNEEDKVESPLEEIVDMEQKTLPKREARRAPIIFDETDFDEGVKEIKKGIPEEEEVNSKSEKALYGGYRDEGTREKFKPSPNISPVYGLVEVSPVLEKSNAEDSKENHVYVPHKQEEVSLDEVRQKAFGGSNEPYFEEDEDLGLLYEMKKDDKPEVSKVTIGDAEEYFDDLGLEYNVDYTDKKSATKSSKEEVKKPVNSIKTDKGTRTDKNKELTEKVENEILEETGEIETLDEVEITKEQIRPRTAEEIKKIKRIEDAELNDKEEPEEKNLYDLIDMMYDSE